jgi:hypothetical protein
MTKPSPPTGEHSTWWAPSQSAATSPSASWNWNSPNLFAMSELSGPSPSDVASPEPVAPDAAAAAAPLDLDRIEADLADVEIALARLDSGEYWRDQVTGEPLDDALLAEHPTARRAADTTR